MGNSSGKNQNDEDIPEIEYQVTVKTGDKKFAGSDSSAGVILHGEGRSSGKIWLDHFFRNDFERGQRDEFKIKAMKMNKIDAIELLRGFAIIDEWFVDTVEIKNEETGEIFVFPVYRWLKPRSSIKIAHLDTALPQFEMFKQQRQQELENKRLLYQLEEKTPGNPPQVKKVPNDEQFSFSYLFDLGAKAAAIGAKATATKKFIPGDKWNDLEHIKASYTSDILPVPESAANWSDEANFGRQRTSAVNNSVIKLCQGIPNKFPVIDDMVKSSLQGLSLQDAMDQNRLFIMDYEILKDVPTRPGFVCCAPLALLFVNDEQDLVPIAIQLYQDPSDENPIFLPSDPKYTWLMAKLWFNNADTAYHQSVTHLGFTHLLMESISVVTNRQLSQSHPIFKLLEPHFLYLIAINALALKRLVGKGEWVDETMNIGRLGMFEIIRRKMKTWKLDTEGTIRTDLSNRGVLPSDVLPNYHFREDSLKLYDAIEKYVRSYINIYYGEDISKLTGDWEIQRWVNEIVKPVERNGVGLKGVPCGKDGKLENFDQLINILTSVIFICSVGHAAANFQQYDEYGFPPNYPAYMKGKPPKDKTALTEKDLLDTLPDQGVTLSIMTITKILSEKATNSLGFFEVRYIHDPDALVVLKQFQDDLHEISEEIRKNSQRDPEYTWLDPKQIPNAISI